MVMSLVADGAASVFSIIPFVSVYVRVSHIIFSQSNRTYD